MQTSLNPAEAREITEKARHMGLEEQMAYLMGFSMDNILAEINRRKGIQERKDKLLEQLDQLAKEERGEL